MIKVQPPDRGSQKLWETVADLAEHFGPDEDWCLAGGLMVQLHAFEHGARARPTSDIDVLADARKRPSATERLANALDGLGARLKQPSVTAPEVAYQFELGDELVEILGPERLKRPPRTIGGYQTIEVPGGTQALRRAEGVLVAVGDRAPVRVRRPTLLGAILLKARAIELHKRPEDHRQDLLLLLGFVDDPRMLGTELSSGERQWLRRAKGNLRFDDPHLRNRFSEGELRRARLALEILTG